MGQSGVVTVLLERPCFCVGKCKKSVINVKIFFGPVKDCGVECDGCVICEICRVL